MRAIIKAIQELINPSEEDLVSIKMRKIEVLKFENTLCEEILDATYKTMSDNLDAIKRIESEIESITGVQSEERPAVGEKIIYRQEKIIDEEDFDFDFESPHEEGEQTSNLGSESKEEPVNKTIRRQEKIIEKEIPRLKTNSTKNN